MNGSIHNNHITMMSYTIYMLHLQFSVVLMMSFGQSLSLKTKLLVVINIILYCPRAFPKFLTSDVTIDSPVWTVSMTTKLNSSYFNPTTNYPSFFFPSWFLVLFKLLADNLLEKMIADGAVRFIMMSIRFMVINDDHSSLWLSMLYIG